MDTKIRPCSFLMLVGLIAASSILSTSASAQTPSINLGRGFRPRFFNSTRYDPDRQISVGQTRFILNTFLDIAAPGPVRVTVEQSGRAVLEASCHAQYVTDTSLRGLDAQGEIRECASEFVDATNIRADQPVDIVLRAPGADGEVEFYRGTFPVIGFRGWEGNRDGQPIYVDQRALRLDSLYGVAFARQYIHLVEFTVATTQAEEARIDSPSLRCKVGDGPWSTYRTEMTGGDRQEVADRVFRGDELQETRFVTEFFEFQAELPIAVDGRTHRPDAGAALDGTWTCELEVSRGGTAFVLRELRFDVRSGYVAHAAIESELPAGRGAALVALGFRADALPTIFDPAIVRSTIAGHRLASGTAPVVSGIPARATNPAFAAVSTGATSSGGRGRRR